MQSRFGNEHEGPSAYIVDDKPLPVSNISGDPDAARGWGAGIYARGYKLHAIIDANNRMIEFDAHALNKAESVAASNLVGELSVERPANLLADAGYDSNPLHRVCEASGIQLIVPRRRLGTGHGWVKGGHSAGRLRSIEITEGPNGEWDRVLGFVRLGIERFFGTRASPATGLFPCPLGASFATGASMGRCQTGDQRGKNRTKKNDSCIILRKPGGGELWENMSHQTRPRLGYGYIQPAAVS